MVEFLGVRRVDAMRASVDDVQLRALDELSRTLTACLEGDDGIGIAVNDKRRDTNSGNDAAEVGHAERRNAVRGTLWRRERGDGHGGLSLRLAHRQSAACGIETCSELVQKLDGTLAERWGSSQQLSMLTTLSFAPPL
jgi:hypothetical protein